jgi:hypothetical protein
LNSSMLMPISLRGAISWARGSPNPLFMRVPS